ncbi:SDR family NAD(P)-dependent oxidoreductase [Chloroflexota bacterium]
MMSELRGKVCLVTAGSRTLGAEITRQMAREGVHVVVNYHQSKDAALHLCGQLKDLRVRAIPVKADVTQPDPVEHLVNVAMDEFGRIDILVNNYGPYVDTGFLDLDLKDFDRVLAGNLRSTFLMTQTVGRVMKNQGFGHIINIAATDFKHRSHSVYGLAKSGLVYFTEAIALELAPQVNVFGLAPDLIADNEDMSPEFVNQSENATPKGRLVTRVEIAKMACALCKPVFDMATGQTILLDGGRSIPKIAI